MTRQEAVLAKAKLLRDPTFAQRVLDGDVEANAAIRQIAEALVGPAETFAERGRGSGELSPEELKVSGF